ncbi:SRPBCC family protein [Arthrobacter sp. NEB 688]|uniref:SRPBCC family protein n=1 Tax=Arthrobacter sp. NEB 688 TaxID=904039 RepID=UPI0015652F5D|nr:SRPBCC family protein [Arthrobacter sp. NEB 688]QKE83519.1 polyketide cyclase [Arthrobacter sp. NEB 688]
MIVVERVVALPPERLWPVLSDVRRWPSWLPTVDAVTPHEPDRPFGPGAAYLVDQPGLPRATWTVTAWEPGRSFTWEARSPGVRTTGTHELLPHADGTTVRLGIAWTGPLAPLVRIVAGRRSRGYVEREAAALEATVRERGA